MCQLQESIRPKEGTPAGLQSNWHLWQLVEECHGSDCDTFGKTSERLRELSVQPGSSSQCQRQAWECRHQLWEHWCHACECRRQGWEPIATQATNLGAPRITLELSGKNNVIFGNTAVAPGNHSHYSSFNDFENSCIQFVFSSIYLYSYPSTHGISGWLAAGGAWEQFEVRLGMTIKWTQRCTSRQWWSQFGDALGRGTLAYWQKLLEVLITWS